MKRSYLYLVVAATMGSLGTVALAEKTVNKLDKATETGAQTLILSPVYVKGDIIAQDFDEGVQSIDVITRQDLNKAAATDLKTLTRYMPGISVAKDGQKGVSQGIRIRGIDFNRITMSIDGDRLPEGQAWGHGAAYNAGRDFIEFDTLKRVDILKEPNSAKHGADTLAGSVNFRTYDPEDFVSLEKPYYLSLKQSHTSANRENKTTVTGAGHLEGFSWILIGTKNRYHETKNRGDNDELGKKRTKPNPLTAKGHNLLGKVAWRKGGQRLSLMAEDYKNDLTVDQMHERSSDNYLYENTLKIKRQRYALDYRLETELSWLDEVDFRVYQNRLTNRDGIRSRFGKNRPTSHNEKDFKVNIVGVRADFNKALMAGSVTHHLAWGVDLRRTKTSRLENIHDSREKQRKDFPDAVAKDIGFYLQDKIDWNNGWRLNVGVNIDRHTLKSDPDEIFLQYGKGDQNSKIDSQYLGVQDYRDTTITPKINLSRVFLEDRAEAYIGYSEGVRHPSFDNLGTYNHGGQHLVANPHLKKERSRNYMAGVLYDDGWSRWGVNGYLSQYHNFIRAESFADAEGQRYTMPVNVKKIKIYGVEANFAQHITEHWILKGSVAWAKSKNSATGRELESNPFDKDRLSVDPLTYTLGLSYEKENWGASLDWKHVNAKSRQYKDQWGPLYIMDSPKYDLLDLTAWWQLDKNIEINAGIYNITNEKYWDGIDLQNEKAQDMWVKWYDHLDRWTQPGRNIAISVKIAL